MEKEVTALDKFVDTRVAARRAQEAADRARNAFVIAELTEKLEQDLEMAFAAVNLSSRMPEEAQRIADYMKQQFEARIGQILRSAYL